VLSMNFDPTKNETNFEKHGLFLSEFEGFDDEPVEAPDDRIDYGEQRLRIFGRIGGVGFMIACAERDGERRIISFRRAHDKEMKRYDK
jgi:uncharacterized protein